MPCVLIRRLPRRKRQCRTLSTPLLGLPHSLIRPPTACCCGWMAKLAVERTLPHSQEHSSYSLLPKETKNNKITILKHSLSVFCFSPLLIWGVNPRSGSSQLISLSVRLFQFLKRRSSATNDLPLLLRLKEFFCSLISISLCMTLRDLDIARSGIISIVPRKIV